MKKAVKVILSIILSLTFVFGMTAVCFAADGQTTAALYNIYSDGMLFQQKKEAVLSGTGNGGDEIVCVLSDESGNLLKTKSYVNRSGEFTVSFTAPEGGYKNYTITIYENGNKFAELKDVVFGELWLASGQSNMEYPFVSSSTYAENTNRSEWIRFLYVAYHPKYNGNTEAYPLEPMKDFEKGSCQWFKGTDTIDQVSAVAVYFAQKLQQELDMPVGIISSSLGGSILLTWLSRETVDSNPDFAEYAKQMGNYISASDWETNQIDPYGTITANFNKKIYPLRNLSIAGMLWYQGETEIFNKWETGYYKLGLELLQSSYSELFGFENGKMPLIMAQVAPYAYGSYKYNLHNNEYVEFQQAEPESRAVTTIYDIDLSYNSDRDALHPAVKQPVGERMAKCAMGLCYGGKCSTAANIRNFRVDGGSIYVTFNDVGEGLQINGKRAYGFSLADESGIYVQAEAEIVSTDTIRIYSDEVKNPVSAAYAFAENNMVSNVYSTLDGEKFMPIAPFDTNINGGLLWEEPVWADCDREEAFFLTGSVPYAGYKKIWQSENAEIIIDKSAPYKGDGCLNIVSDSTKKKFSVSPVYTFNNGETEKYYDNLMRDWSHYSSVSVMVRNNGENDIMLEGMKIYVSPVTWFAPEVNCCGESCMTIPADGKWYKLTFDLDRLYLHGDECGAIYSRRKLNKISNFELCFKDGKTSSDISVDEFRFIGDASDGKRGTFEPCLLQADNPWEFFCGIFTSLFGLIVKFFS